MNHLIALLALLLLTSCSIEPVGIEYNHDECSYCKMKISDVRFGAELVSKKGKVFKFDSAECLFRTYMDQKNPQYAHILVTDYTNPQTLIDAKSATFLVSKNIPSPMGGNLSSYKERSKAADMRSEDEDQIFTFEKLLSKYKLIK